MKTDDKKTDNGNEKTVRPGTDNKGRFTKGNKCHHKKRNYKKRGAKSDLPKVVKMFIGSAIKGGQTFVDELRKQDAGKFITALASLQRFAEDATQDAETIGMTKCPCCEFNPNETTIKQHYRDIDAHNKVGIDQLRTDAESRNKALRYTVEKQKKEIKHLKGVVKDAEMYSRSATAKEDINPTITTVCDYKEGGPHGQPVKQLTTSDRIANLEPGDADYDRFWR